ncbi:XrtA/PEP-CTERM system exopolysaccharide export protein [Mangrovitalea sediminis]|uniref:XrtA/PEP-CTERM system exopolysaccharide export protein n=1 Tax=Mangrovitalea sediminis TaxID=1982043 RepID=UPI000BE53A79|nr:XrtA/PEP-CTERM system exopolysaccharide export protein [Mangrovitalea sediminis]
MARMFKILLAVVSMVWLAGCAGPQISSQQQIKAALSSTPESVKQYVLGPSDVVNVSVWRNQDLSVTVPIRPDGKISVPLLGDVQAAGLTPEALANNIQSKLGVYIREPKVSVIVEQMISHEYTERVRITGAVKSPMSAPYREGMTVLDMVLGAGGLNDFAAPNKAVLYRKVGKDIVAIPVHLDDILNQGDIATNYKLHAGDILTIPERTF